MYRYTVASHILFFYCEKPSLTSPATKPNPRTCLIGKLLSKPSIAIHPFLPPQTLIKWYIVCKYTIYTIIHIFLMENGTQWAQQQNWAQVSPTSTACLIGKARLLEHIVNYEHNHPTAISGIVYMYLPVPPTPCSTALPSYTTPPSHIALLAYQQTYLPTQKTLLLILTNPGTMAILFFLGGRVCPICIYEVTWA